MKFLFSCLFIWVSIGASLPVMAQKPIAERFMYSNRSYAEVRKIWTKKGSISAQVRRMDRAMARYTDVSQCTWTHPITGEMRFGWFWVRNEWPISICMFLIAEQLETPHEMVKFLEREGLYVHLQDTRNKTSHRRSYMISAFDTFRHFSFSFKFQGASFLPSRIVGMVVGAPHVVVIYDKSGAVARTSVDVNWM